MRLLFTFVGGHGHLQPLVPLARCALAAGHSVAFGCQQALLGVVAQAGFEVFDTGGRTFGDPATRQPLVAADMQHEFRVLRDVFAGSLATERAGRISQLAEQWRPDLIVCDEIDFGSMVAAERLGLPHVTVLVIASGSFVRHELLAAPLNTLRVAYGLPADPYMYMLSRFLVLVPFPLAFRDPDFPLPATAFSMRPAVLEPHSAQELLPEPMLPGAPLVYFTLGTVFNVESGDLFNRVLAGLARLHVNVIVTTGNAIDPAVLGLQPAHIHVYRYLPEAAVLPHCDAVVSHGGSGSVIAALAYGLPLVLLPMGADQPLNAERCQALGCAVVLDPVHATPDQLAAAVRCVLDEPGYRQSAETLHDSIRMLPGAEEALQRVELVLAADGARPKPGCQLSDP